VIEMVATFLSMVLSLSICIAEHVQYLTSRCQYDQENEQVRLQEFVKSFLQEPTFCSPGPNSCYMNQLDARSTSVTSSYYQAITDKHVYNIEKCLFWYGV